MAGVGTLPPIDECRLAEFRNRGVVEDLDHAFRGRSEDVTQLTDDDRQWWRIRRSSAC